MRAAVMMATATAGQGAPRTCRCIETDRLDKLFFLEWKVREHHAPVGALRQDSIRISGMRVSLSGSTAHL